MNILSKLFKKRQQSTSDNFKVVLNTKRELSEKQKNAIIAIVKDGSLSGAQLSDIAINIMEATGIYEPVIMTRTENGVEVTF